MPTPEPREAALFSAALKRPAAERAAFLDGACQGDATLRERLETLLAAHVAKGSLPEPAGLKPAGELEKTVKINFADMADEAVGQTLGRYKLLEKVGEGGFGVVYVAEQSVPVRRRVALKVIKLGMDTKQVIARFEAERQALAMMDHPNIAKVLDGGTTEQGRPYFVMELVRGIRITDYCDQAQLGTRERLDLFIRVCQAIQHAHQKGIIHRDIKPSNILVTLLDGVPVPKVIDFGIAKATEGRLTDATVYTQLHQFMGTPAYMSPEQAEMSGLDIDTRSDIYSMGVLLYELLIGRTPFDGEELMLSGIDAMRRTIREEDPLRPSTKIAKLEREEQTTAARRRSIDISKLIHQLKGDLDWIVMKCLEKNRARRYETANELAVDVRRHLDNEPVSAGPPAAMYRLEKFIIRNKWPVILNVTVVGLTVAGLIGTSIGLRHARAARILADENAARATQLAREAKTAEAAALNEKAFALRQAYSASMASASDAIQGSHFDTARHYLNNAPSDLRGWEWRHLASRLDQTTRIQERPRRPWAQIHMAPDGRSYYDVCPHPAIGIQRWDTDSGRLLATISTERPCWNSWLVAGGKQMAVLSGEARDLEATIDVWDLERGARLLSIPASWPVSVSSDGSCFASLKGDRIAVTDLKSGATRLSPTAVVNGPFGQSCEICFSPDGRRLAVCKVLGEVALLDASSLEILSSFKLHDNSIRSPVFSSDSRFLATGSLDSTIRITDVTVSPPAPVATLRGHSGVVTGLCFSPDGSLLASYGDDRTLRVWDVRTATPKSVSESDGLGLAFLPDGRTLLNGDTNGVRIRDLRSVDAVVLRAHESYVYPTLLSPDGGMIYSGGWDGFAGKPGCLRFWDAATGNPVAATGPPDASVFALALSADGSLLSIAQVANDTKSAFIKTLDTATGATLSSVADWADSLAFDPASPTVAWVDPLGRLCLRDAPSGSLRDSRPLFGTTNQQSRLAWSPDGATIAVSVSPDPDLYVVEAKSLAVIRHWPHRHNGAVISVSFSPDSRRIATTSDDGIVSIWDADTGALLHDLVGHNNRVFCAAFSPDGKRIASGGNDDNVRIWDARTFEQVARLTGHDQYVYSLAWRADSELLISGSGDHTIRIWDTLPLKERAQARRERQDILALVEPMVQQLFAELGDAGKVVKKIKADATLSARSRQVALQVVLRTSLDRINAAAPAHPQNASR